MQKNYLNSLLSIRNEISGIDNYFNAASMGMHRSELDCTIFPVNLQTVDTAQMLFIIGMR